MGARQLQLPDQPHSRRPRQACGAAIMSWKFEYCDAEGRDDCGDCEWWAEFNALVYLALAASGRTGSLIGPGVRRTWGGTRPNCAVVVQCLRANQSILSFMVSVFVCLCSFCMVEYLRYVHVKDGDCYFSSDSQIQCFLLRFQNATHFHPIASHIVAESSFIRYSVTVNISRFHREARGSIPRTGDLFANSY